MASETSTQSYENPELFLQLDSYPWDTDEEFQGGLRAILGSVQDPAQVEHLTLRAKCYYYARKAGTTVDFNGYKRWVEDGHGLGSEGPTQDDLTANFMATETKIQQSDVSGSSSSNGMADAPRPATFAQICEMIADGKPIPGIKDIPDTVLEGQASTKQAAARKKPWEKAAPESGSQGNSLQSSWMK